MRTTKINGKNVPYLTMFLGFSQKDTSEQIYSIFVAIYSRNEKASAEDFETFIRGCVVVQ